MTPELPVLTNRLKGSDEFELASDNWYHMAPLGEFPHSESGLAQIVDRSSVADEASAQRWLETFRGRLERRGDVLVVTKRMALVVHEPESDDADTRGLELLSSDQGEREFRSATAGAKQPR